MDSFSVSDLGLFAFLYHHPVVQGRILIGDLPDVVPFTIADFDFGVAAKFVDGFHHGNAFRDRNSLIVVAMVDHDGQVFNTCCIPVDAAATDGRDAGKTLRIGHSQHPSAGAAHAEAGETYTVFVNG